MRWKNGAALSCPFIADDVSSISTCVFGWTDVLFEFQKQNMFNLFVFIVTECFVFPNKKSFIRKTYVVVLQLQKSNYVTVSDF